MFFSFGLWNVLLFPFSIRRAQGDRVRVRPPGGVTSVGFVVGSLLMARVADRLREGPWIVIGVLGMGILGIAYGLVNSIAVAIVIAGCRASSTRRSLARRLILQRNTPREFRGRIFSTMGVLRDVVFLLGMVAAGLADYVDIRLLVVLSGVILILTGIWTQSRAGLGPPAAEWRQVAQRLRTASAPGALVTRPMTAADLALLVGQVPAFGRIRRRGAAHPAGSGAPGGGAGGHAPTCWPATRATRPSSSCPGMGAVAGIPVGERRVPRSVHDGGWRHVRRDRRPDRQSGGPANVVTDADAVLLEIPATTLHLLMGQLAISEGVRPKLTETSRPDDAGGSAAVGRTGPAGSARTAHASATCRGAPSSAGSGRPACQSG